jgi:hypothetical protein
VFSTTADKREFLRISQAVGMGFLIMGVIGYIVKLSKFSFRSIPRPALLFLPTKMSSAGGGRASETFERRERRAGETRSSCILYGELTYLLPLTVHIPVNNILVGGA